MTELRQLLAICHGRRSDLQAAIEPRQRLLSGSLSSVVLGRRIHLRLGVEAYSVWRRVLAPLRKTPVRIVEIGSWEGRSALFFLKYLPYSRIVCIDTFQGTAEEG